MDRGTVCLPGGTWARAERGGSLASVELLAQSAHFSTLACTGGALALTRVASDRHVRLSLTKASMTRPEPSGQLRWVPHGPPAEGTPAQPTPHCPITTPVW